MRDDPWLAGFADGEGCFKITARHNPAFTINLRADDYQVLERLHEAFGGGLSMKQCQGGERNSRPQFEWNVSGKAELRGLVDYFDRFPLRSKKARDYAVWRRAVLIYCRGSRLDPEMPFLRQALRDGRAYEQTDLPESPQLQLVS